MIEARKGYKIAHFTKVWTGGYREESTFKVTEKINKTIQMFTGSYEIARGCREESNCFIDQMSVVPEIRSISGSNAPVVFNFHTDIMYCGVVTFRQETFREYLVDEVINEDDFTEDFKEAFGSLVSVEYYPGEEPD